MLVWKTRDKYNNQNPSWKTNWDFEIQTDHPIQASGSYLVLINKEKYVISLVLLFQWIIE